MEFAVLEEPFGRQHCQNYVVVVVVVAADAVGAVVVLR